MDMLNILITNDDGICAPGIARLAAAALPYGHVFVCAPDSQCSGMSQRVTISGKLPVRAHDFPVPVEAAWSIGGTPTDCVRTAVRTLLPVRPDIVLTGVNNGYNVGFDIAYSGTVGAAMEALLSGIPAIAFSARESCAGEWLDAYLPDVLGELLAHPAHPGCLWNVNFPDCPKEQCRGVRRGTVPARYGLYDNEYIRDGAHLRIASTVADPALCREGSDIHAVLNGYISIGEIRSPLL